MREIISHKQELDEEGKPVDLPGAGPNKLFRVFAEPHNQAGAMKFDSPHQYEIYRRAHNNWESLVKIRFQKGPFKEATPTGDYRELAPNGITNEVLLAILIDRFENYQRPPAGSPSVPCNENDKVLGHLKQALGFLHHRTEGRIDRNVERSKQQ